MDSWGPETQKKEIKEMQFGMKWFVSSQYKIGKYFQIVFKIHLYKNESYFVFPNQLLKIILLFLDQGNHLLFKILCFLTISAVV